MFGSYLCIRITASTLLFGYNYSRLYSRYIYVLVSFIFFFFKQKTADGMRISDRRSDVCSSDLSDQHAVLLGGAVTDPLRGVTLLEARHDPPPGHRGSSRATHR